MQNLYNERINKILNLIQGRPNYHENLQIFNFSLPSLCIRPTIQFAPILAKMNGNLKNFNLSLNENLRIEKAICKKMNYSFNFILYSIYFHIFFNIDLISSINILFAKSSFLKILNLLCS